MDFENTGNVYSDDTQANLLATDTVTFAIAQEGVITMTKVVDRPGELYFRGDEITFTITITNNGTVAANNLFFVDEIDESVVPLVGTNYEVTTTSGTVTSAANPININNIDIPAGGTVTIIIVGRIAE